MEKYTLDDAGIVKLSEQEEKELDTTFGIGTLTIKLQMKQIKNLEHLAKEQGIIPKALVRKILTDYLKEKGLE